MQAPDEILNLISSLRSYLRLPNLDNPVYVAADPAHNRVPDFAPGQHNVATELPQAGAGVIVPTPLGTAMNATFIANISAQDPLLSQLMIKNLNYGIFQAPFDTSLVSRVTLILCFLRYQLSGMQGNLMERRTEVHCLAAAELLAPYPDMAKFLSIAEAQNEFRKLIRYGAAHADDLALPSLAAWYAHEVYALGSVADLTIKINNGTLTMAECMIFLIGWSVKLPASDMYINGLSLFSMVIAAIAKKGVVSDGALQKIRQAANAGRYFSDIAGLFGGSLMRLTITIQQTAGTGLTTYLTIRRAMELVPEFPWSVAYNLIPNDFIAYLAAAHTVDGNEFFGFNRDLGDAASTKYPEIGYLGFQICIHVLHDMALRDYRGMPTQVRQKSALDRLVTAYRAQEANRIQAIVSDATSIRAITGLYEALFDRVEAGLLIERYRAQQSVGMNADMQLIRVAPTLIQPSPTVGAMPQPSTSGHTGAGLFSLASQFSNLPRP